MSSVRSFMMQFVNQHNVIRRIAKHFMRTWWNVRFKLTDLCVPTQAQTVVFEVYQGRQYTCSPRAIYEEMLRQKSYRAYHFIWVFREPERYRYLEKNRNTTVVPFGGQAYYRAFAKSRYWFVNSRTRRCMIPGKTHCYVQTWHGTPLKRLGCDIAVEGNNIVSAKEMRADYRNEGSRVTYFISPSAFYSEKIASAFAIADKKECILETGYPRNDCLFDHDPAKLNEIRRRIGLPSDKKVILYAPTFRDNQHHKNGCDLTLGFDIGKFVEEFGNEYVMLFRTHYFITSQIDLKPWQGIVYDMTAWEDINELYKVSDLLITDYSSVFFDYANLKRPIIFFMYDLAEYRDHIRDFYLDIRDLPGNVVQTEQELYQEIRRIESSEIYDERYQRFHNTYNYLDGPHTSKAVLDRVIQVQKRES